MTSDKWETYTDHEATYQPSSSKTTDTFSFDFEIATSGDDPNAVIEFCICYQAGTPESKI